MLIDFEKEAKRKRKRVEFSVPQEFGEDILKLAEKEGLSVKEFLLRSFKTFKTIRHEVAQGNEWQVRRPDGRVRSARFAVAGTPLFKRDPDEVQDTSSEDQEFEIGDEGVISGYLSGISDLALGGVAVLVIILGVTFYPFALLWKCVHFIRTFSDALYQRKNRRASKGLWSDD